MSDSELKGQLELGIGRIREQDRNYHLGGRSFYFFDFDDNIMFLSTPIILFHREHGGELALSSGEWARSHHVVGKAGVYQDYQISYDEKAGSFRHFRDHHPEELVKLGARQQLFLQDLSEALGVPDLQWKGPSWECFYHATFNQRPVSLITARGHHPDTVKDGVRLLVQRRVLPLEPNYLSVFTVSNKEIRRQLGDNELTLSIAELKQRAIRESVEEAIRLYGNSPHHRFGMSDDDPKNIQLIAEEMARLKGRFPQMSFFLIETHNGQFIKHEVQTTGLSADYVERLDQLSLFEGHSHTST